MIEDISILKLACRHSQSIPLSPQPLIVLPMAHSAIQLHKGNVRLLHLNLFCYVTMCMHEILHVLHAIQKTSCV